MLVFVIAVAACPHACRGAGLDAGQGVRACRYHKLGAGLDTAGACRFSLWFFLAGSGVSGLIGASLVSLVLSVLVLLVHGFVGASLALAVFVDSSPGG